ncbi:unnamed protein product [Rotaria sordida]|uniref:Uncharacterized protein n=1 Tax=Rotaria sordida TaxID=392033 RepID=A0A814TCP8_9BILA|nr:unnamed protein product [Rotaria sordida]CAF1158321.1 unnamed protein product [Rotaria sordida]CAF3786769.1 unnamed protein product [Rotaria sordida]CAF3799090.1 unnamed protein product [Rotaria sordida]
MKSREPTSAKHSTADPASLLPDAIKSGFDSSHTFHKEQTADSFAPEHKKYNNELSSGLSDFGNPGISRTVDDSSQDFLDARRDDLNDDITPGPGAYTLDSQSIMRTVYKSSPAYTLGRRFSYFEPYGSPGPGAYGSINFSNKQQAPRHSFGIRHSMYQAPFIFQQKK